MPHNSVGGHFYKNRFLYTLYKPGPSTHTASRDRWLLLLRTWTSTLRHGCISRRTWRSETTENGRHQGAVRLTRPVLMEALEVVKAGQVALLSHIDPVSQSPTPPHPTLAECLIAKAAATTRICVIGFQAAPCEVLTRLSVLTRAIPQGQGAEFRAVWAADEWTWDLPVPLLPYHTPDCLP